jgi:hypothetical protein
MLQFVTWENHFVAELLYDGLAVVDGSAVAVRRHGAYGLDTEVANRADSDRSSVLRFCEKDALCEASRKQRAPAANVYGTDFIKV